MVVADDELAAEWGAEVLRAGGNAIDAAVATAFVMSVTRPQFASLGGGGFLVYCPKPTRSGPAPCTTIDYREEAPASASREMFVRDGKARTDLSQNGALASGVPGVPAGLLLAHERFGKAPRAYLMSRAIDWADRGMAVSGHTETTAALRWDAMNGEARRIFGCAAFGVPSAPCAAGTSLRQPELAAVLREISDKGASGFYQGWVAEKIASGIQAGGGVLTAQDLAAYRARERKPIAGRYRGMEVVSMPPPSSGGILLLQMLDFAERADRARAFDEGFGSAGSVNALAHAMSLAFADRTEYFGDPDHVEVPVEKLLSQAYLESRWRTFNPSRANHGVRPGTVWMKPPVAAPAAEPKVAPSSGVGVNTTHFSVIDREGNAVVVTTTVNDNFGSGFVPPGTGVVMNNEMDDFSIQPGVPNLFGLVGSEANAIAPRKRPLSSMTPTIVRDTRGNARLLLGAQGGPRIITSVYQALVNRLRFDMAITDAVTVPKIHHQWKPDELSYERHGLSPDTQRRLKEMGHRLKDVSGSGRMQVLERFPNGRVWGAADPRTEGYAAAE